MIEVEALTKRYGSKVAVDDLSLLVQPGRVTGFLGPNGAGKSTTMRLILGLDTPTSGRARVNGRSLRDHAAPLTQIGALLEARGIHPKRSARDHLRALAASNGIGDARVDHVLGLVGLEEVADRAAGGFSLGMGQRLGIASALLGDPETVMLDEPVNGLDPEGILWIRHLLSRLAAEGRTVFVSSHLMNEMAMIAEYFVVIGRGRMIASGTAAELGARDNYVRVRSTDQARLDSLLSDRGASVTAFDGALHVRGPSTDGVGLLAAESGIAVLELSSVEANLEDIFLRLTSDAVEYHGAAGVPA
jgi:ABC-2 type transport system ATP-binding protein